MKKHEFKNGDGVLGTNTTKEQRAEILAYAHENGYNIFNITWDEKRGYTSNNNKRGFYFNGEDFIGCDDSLVTNPMTYAEIMTKINPEWLKSKPYIPEKYEEALFWYDDKEEAEVREFLCYNEKSDGFPYIVTYKGVTICYKNCKPLPKEEPKKKIKVAKYALYDKDEKVWIETHAFYKDDENTIKCFDTDKFIRLTHTEIEVDDY